MRPKLRARMPSMTSRVMLNTESRLVRITASQLSLVMRCSMPSRVMPALLTSTSIGPEVARDARHALLAGGVVADVPLVDGNAGLGLELARGGIVAAVVGGHAEPLCLSAIEIACPIPRVPPVTTATRAICFSSHALAFGALR